MIRSIEITTDVYAAIWATRLAGEDNENDILARIFKCSPKTHTNVEEENVSSLGVYDSRNDVRFPANFEIFRTYKGNEFRAEARNGRWYRFENGQSFATLNQLNASITAGSENVWNGNWKYRAPDGRSVSIGELRAS